MRAGTRGTTLVELLVVLAIASVALTLVIPSVRAGRAELQLRDGVRVVMGVINEARNRAVLRQQTVLLRFDEAHARIYMSDPSKPGMQEVSLPEDVQLRIGGESDEGNSPTASTAESASPSYEFPPDGAVPELRIRVVSGQRVNEIQTDPLAGIAEVRRSTR